MAITNLESIGYQINKHPIAQSFIVDNTDGIFLTKVGLFFADAPSGSEAQHPITLQIRPITDSGVPSSNVIVPSATVVKEASSVYANISTDATVETTFEFKHPIFLKGGKQYAVVLITNSAIYKVYIGEAYAFKLGTTEERCASNPISGTLFRSSNSITFSPVQNQDLAMKLYKAKFKYNSAQVVLHNSDVPPVNLRAGSISTESDGTSVRISSWMHGLQTGDNVTISNVSDTIGGLIPSKLNGTRAITGYDFNSFTVNADSTASFAAVGGTDSATITKNLLFNRFVPKIQKLQPLNTTVAGSFRPTRAESFAGQGSPYTKETAFSNIDLNITNQTANNTYLVANAERETAELGSGIKSLDLKALLQTANPTDVSPIIDLQRTSFSTVATVIDNQLPTWGTQDSADLASAGSSLYNTSLNFSSETNPTRGSSAARWISKIVTLEELSKGIKILVSANVPPYSYIDVYYRTSISTETLRDQSWVLIDPEVSMPNDENPNIFRGYTYLAGGTSGTLDDFIAMQFKVVMRSSYIHKSPTIRDFRAIAMVV